MSTTTASRRGARAAKSKAASRRRSLLRLRRRRAGGDHRRRAASSRSRRRARDAKIPPRVATGDGRVLGDANAPVTVVEYADFQCPVCKRAETSIISQIEKDYVQQGKVKIEFRMFPFLGQESFNAAQAAEAAREQGKFWEYHDALFNAQGRENSGTFTYEKLVALAQAGRAGRAEVRGDAERQHVPGADPGRRLTRRGRTACRRRRRSSSATRRSSGRSRTRSSQAAIDAALAKAAS